MNKLKTIKKIVCLRMNMRRNFWKLDEKIQQTV